MYGIRWLPVMLVVLAACVAAPEAQAQTWLRWSKASAVKDPAKQLAPPKRQAVVLPTVASAQPKLTPVPIKEPQTERSEAVLQATVPAARGPTVTIIEDPIVEAASQPAPVVASIPSPPLVSASPAPPAPRSPPAPVFDPLPLPATATPVQIDDAVIQAAPLALTAEVAAAPPLACSDCPTQDELQAISAAPGNGANRAPEDQKIQSEIKRRLLQGN